MEDDLSGIDEIEKFTSLSSVTIQDLKNTWGLPVKKVGSVMCATRSGLTNWLKENGLESWSKFSLAKVKAVQLRKLRQGPGKVLTGDMDHICNRLDIAPGTFIDYLKYDACPIHRLDDRRFSVDVNRFIDFLEDLENIPRKHGLGGFTQVEG